MHAAKSRRSQVQVSRCGSHQGDTNTVMMCDKRCRVVPTRGAHLSLDVQRFYQVSLTQSCSNCITYLYYPDSSHFRAKQSLTQISFASINSNQTSLPKKTPIRENIPKAQSLSPQSQLKALVRNVHGFSNSSLLS